MVGQYRRLEVSRSKKLAPCFCPKMWFNFGDSIATLWVKVEKIAKNGQRHWKERPKKPP